MTEHFFSETWHAPEGVRLDTFGHPDTALGGLLSIKDDLLPFVHSTSMIPSGDRMSVRGPLSVIQCLCDGLNR